MRERPKETPSVLGPPLAQECEDDRMLTVSELHTVSTEDGRLKLTKRLRVRSANLSITVPVGFVTDGFSVPKWARWFHSNLDAALSAAVVHDYLCDNRVIGTWFASAIFHAILIAHGVPSWKARVLTWAVQLRGPQWQ